MVGRIPSLLHPLLIGQHGIQAIYNSPVDLMGINLAHENAFAGARFFNWVASGAMVREQERVRDIVVPIESLGEAITYAAATAQSSSISSQAIRPFTHTGFDNDEMNGLTAVDVLFIESVDDPATPENENEFTWTTYDADVTASRISSGFYWWVEIANVMGINPPLSYVLTIWYPTNSREWVPLEPIRRYGYPQDFDWVAPITANHGVTEGSDSRTRARAYGRMAKNRHGANSGFPVFVTYNPSPAPTGYLDGQSAWAWYGDYVNMLFRNGGYPDEQTGWVFAHEAAHVFWGCDEYPIFPYCTSDCRQCYIEGPRPNLGNYNCLVCPVSEGTPCIMHTIDYTMWINHSTCGITRLAIGWPH